MGLFLRALAAAGVAVVLLPSPGSARTWGSPTTSPSLAFWPALAPLPASGSLLVYQRGNDGLGARTVDPTGSVGDEESLAATEAGQPGAATDDAGEAVVAWYDWYGGTVDVDVRGPDGTVAAAAAFPGTATSVPPRVSTSPTGWAAVAFPVDTPAGTRTFVSVRPPGGGFAPPEPAAPDAQGGPQSPGAVAVDGRGEVVVGYMQDGVAHVAVRTAGALGAWQPAQALGAPYLDPYPGGPLPLVAIAADGGAVAVWEEGGGQNLVAPVMASFRPPGGSFGDPQDLGVSVWDGEGVPALAVSAQGEAILVVPPARQATGGVWPQPLVVLSGATALGRFAAPEQLSDDWAPDGPVLAMNARGDAVVAWTSCCPPTRLETRRRAPFGPFEPEQDIALPASSGYYTQQVNAAAIDRFGNATLTWVDYTTSDPRRMLATDGPVLDAAPDVVPPPSAGAPTDLAPAPIVPAAPLAPDPAPWPVQDYDPCLTCFLTPPGFTWWPFPAPAVAPAPDTPAPPSSTDANRPSRAPEGPLALAVPRLPAVTGTPRIVVAVSCPWACRASVVATLVTPQHRRLRLPRVALTADAAGIVTAPLPLTPAAARALKVAPAPRRGAARVTPSRRFTLDLTAAAGDRTGAPQTVSIKLSFARR